MPEVIETARLRLRPWELGDVGDVYAYARDEEWSRVHWNRGFVTEAAGAVIDAAFTTCPDLDRIRAMADVENTASRRVMEKLGMMKEGVLRRNRVERGVAIDEAWYGILRAEWETPGRSRGSRNTSTS